MIDMDFTQPQQESTPQMHIPRYVFTGIIVGVLALFVGTMFFMYNMQRETDAARRANVQNKVYRKISPSPTLQPTVTVSAEEQMIDGIIIEDPTNEFTVLEQEAESL